MKSRVFLGDQVAIITGGGGIGWGIAMEFAREGAQVVIIDKDKQKGEEVLAEVRKISQGHQFEHWDIRQIDKIEEKLANIKSHYPQGVDILVNNAGVNSTEAFLSLTPEAWDEVQDTNLRAHAFLSQAVAREWIDHKRSGVILFTTSVHQDVIEHRPSYSTSKAALKMLIKEMAAELAPHNIRVVGVAPGGIHIRNRTEDPLQAKVVPQVPLGGRDGIPRDIGRAAVFLCSDYWARFITGETLTVSGGQYLDPTVK